MFFLGLLWSILAMWELIDLLIKGDIFDAVLFFLDCMILGRLSGIYSLVYWWWFDLGKIFSKKKQRDKR